LVAALSSGTPIYQGRAPHDTEFPYIVFRHASGGEENMTPVRTLDVRYDVIAISDTLAGAEDAAELADEQMLSANLTITGWCGFWISRQQLVEYEAIEDNELTFYRGASYRIRAAREST
jgi:hypothetical protein